MSDQEMDDIDPLDSLEAMETNDDNDGDGANGSSDSSDDSDGEDGGKDDQDDDDSVDEDEINAEIEKVKLELAGNPYDYDLHVKMIETTGKARKCGEYELVRAAREAMSAQFPLTPELWMDWIEDERKLSTMVDPDAKVAERERIFKLFDRALDDYVSIDVWMKYCDYIISFIDEPDAIKWISVKFERALQEVGLHVTKGTLVWETYRELLSALAGLIQEPEVKLKKYEQIYELYKRQLSIPLYGMQHIYKEFQAWCANTKEEIPEFAGNPESIKFAYEQAYSMLQKIQTYEDELLATGKPSLNAYQKYIEFEETNGTPPRVQCIYERALIDYCLVPDLWINFTRYLCKKVRLPALVKKTYERSLRNYSWSVDIWVNYMKACETFREEMKVIINIFERALAIGFQTGNELRQLWLAYLDCLRRQTDWKDTEAVEKLKKNFKTGIDHLAGVEYGDPNAELSFYLARIYAKCLDDLDSARELLTEVFKQREIAYRAEMWIEYAQFERCFGDEKHYKRILLKALNTVGDWPETIGAALLRYEREEGSSLEQYDEILEKYESIMKRTGEKRGRQAEKEKSDFKGKQGNRRDRNRGYNQKVTEETTRNAGQKHRKQETDRKVSEFKAPQPPQAKTSAAKVAQSIDDESMAGPSSAKKVKLSATVTTDETVLAEMKRQQDVAQRSDDIKKMHTVFLSNLDFKVDEDTIRQHFADFGKIVDLRLVRNFKGQSKGFCYVEYEDMSGVKEALKHDRITIESRPVFVSEMDKKAEFKFKTTKETNKLFVKGLAPSVTPEVLSETFKKYGDLKDVRLVTYRNGHSKGCAYIEYRSELDAQKALEADGMLLADKNIKVAISDPSARNRKDEGKVLGSGHLSMTAGPLGGGAKKKIDLSSMVPASVRRTMARGGK